MPHPRSHPAFRKRGTLSKAEYEASLRPMDPALCDCQNPVEANGGAAGVSMGCPIHNDLSEADKRTQRWLRELELE